MQSYTFFFFFKNYILDFLFFFFSDKPIQEGLSGHLTFGIKPIWIFNNRSKQHSNYDIV